MSAVLPLLGDKRKSDFGAVRTVVDPQRTSLHPVKCQGCRNGLSRSRECKRSRCNCQVCPIDLKVANLIPTDTLRPPSSEHMVNHLVSVDGIGPRICAHNRSMNIRKFQ